MEPTQPLRGGQGRTTEELWDYGAALAFLMGLGLIALCVL